MTAPEGLPLMCPFLPTAWQGRGGGWLQSAAWWTLRALGTGARRSSLPKDTTEQVCQAWPPISEFCQKEINFHAPCHGYFGFFSFCS